MILANTGKAPVESDIHEVPTVHVDAKARHSIVRYLGSAEKPTASLEPVQRPARSARDRRLLRTWTAHH